MDGDDVTERTGRVQTEPGPNVELRDSDAPMITMIRWKQTMGLTKRRRADGPDDGSVQPS